MRTEPVNILFVCTGNVCRSPVAEHVLRWRGQVLGLDLKVESAGTRALNGRGIHPESEKQLLEMGIDSGQFESRMLTPQIVSGADLILGLTREHRAFARQLAPARWRKMFTLRELALSQLGGRGEWDVDGVVSGDSNSAFLDIEDPMGKSVDVFTRTTAEIVRAIEALTVQLSDRSPGS